MIPTDSKITSLLAIYSKWYINVTPDCMQDNFEILNVYIVSSIM